jgi:hypothetical protein
MPPVTRPTIPAFFSHYVAAQEWAEAAGQAENADQRIAMAEIAQAWASIAQVDALWLKSGSS